MSRPFAVESYRQQERLRALIARLSDQDLSRPLADGWTVAAILAHLAFWDYRALLLIRRWKQTGVQPSPIDVDTVNDAMLPLLVAVPPRRAAEIAIEAAASIDKEIESLSEDLMAQIEAKATALRPNRALHRIEHLNQIESALSQRK